MLFRSEGTLRASNLEVVGDRTIINTETYQTENLHIMNDSADGASIKVQHRDANNHIFEASNLNNEFVILDKDVRLGINKVPVAQLDVNGDTIINGSLTVTGAQTAGGDYNIDGTLIVNTDVFINRNQIVEGSAITRGDQLVQGNQLINGDLEVEIGRAHV